MVALHPALAFMGGDLWFLVHSSVHIALQSAQCRSDRVQEGLSGGSGGIPADWQVSWPVTLLTPVLPL